MSVRRAFKLSNPSTASISRRLTMARDCQAIRVVLLLALVLYSASELVAGDNAAQPARPKRSSTVSSRKLLPIPIEGKRANNGTRCRTDDIELFQAQVSPSYGLPTYMVRVMNLCTNCTMYNIHVTCRWFSSAHMINPKVFRRLRYDDCLLNGGRDFKAGDVISFSYCNSFKYPLTISSVKCR